MGTKNKIGGLIILGGIAFIGVYWFKKNKPTLSSSQDKELQALSNFYKTGGDDYIIGGIEKPTYYKLNLADVNYGNMTPKEKEELQKAIGNIPDTSNIISNQISQNLQGADFSSLSSLGLAGVTFNMKK